ncbi:hypothetical protein [Acinetobacter baumannii]|uniref:hypothetical protein n=1 Tax=Acinetobacter baumannii TaxID=470 RepID=UPI00244B3469|nr:hypothetical protein [Acinetobacter baumannii]MDH2662948.1 hypothetical protein [Acinetobacter baumannii]
MTDLNKERELELFNAFVQKELPELFEKHSNSNFFAKIIYDSMFGAWLGAKAQAVPEGYVLVKRDATKAMIEAGDDLVDHNGYGTCVDMIWDAMVEASESGAEG